MILYFSGTGNSKYVAEKIADKLHDETFSINDAVKTKTAANLMNADKLVFVTPTYAWRIPHVVSDWILRGNFNVHAKVWFVMTCGGDISNAAKYNKKISEKKNFEYMGTMQIVMPENYIAMFDVPGKEESLKIIKNSESEVEKAINCIAHDTCFPKLNKNLYDKFMSGPVNKIFYSMYVKSDKFFASDKCIGCGKCVSVCPLNNIELVDGKPQWGKDCTHCMACICYCPTCAIEYGDGSKKRIRYNIESVLK